ncbi:PhzF family phenazine biosynthesis protein [Kribbella orskensis]|uniref:PhzF family phenazine biosynthesis protein n=1 Tax=Kribbella orskensis TaxID=2512216 RepID=A0ABY2BMN4_9ACTN|nr:MULTISPECIES: PhzF family phenazine biosynthesis isomerase [Kribbella]TCN41630.1 PhzF family phenazine biosynthesis protein [Kribbella sp. VKM Ac-2500]TCO25508.1 PhzF family phenazine biosynthesis protein [Kribbella orskensis]
MNRENTTEILRYAAFTSDPAGGNPAGVVLDATGLDESQMLAIAAELGYSETAFVTARDDEHRRFRLRYFSPLAEVAFCGHVTVATAVALAERIGSGELAFDTPAGEIRVATAVSSAGTARATLTSVPTRSRPAVDAELDAALSALGWERDDLDPALPPHVAFGGNEHLVLAAASRARLADLTYDFDGLAEVMRIHDWVTVQLVWRETPDLFHARNPFPVGGVVEDPATGAAAAALGGYLRTIGQVKEAATIAIRQGEDMGRPSDLTIEVDPVDARVRVTGQAVPIDR